MNRLPLEEPPVPVGEEPVGVVSRPDVVVVGPAAVVVVVLFELVLAAVAAFLRQSSEAHRSYGEPSLVWAKWEMVIHF